MSVGNLSPSKRRVDASPELRDRSYPYSSTFVRVALPAFNEEDSLPLLIPRIHQALHEAGFRFDILIVDDCSFDKTANVASQLSHRYPIRIHSHTTNQGLGGAISTCILEAIEGLDDDDIVVTLDADNTHPPQLITKMIPMIREGRDIVIASRYRDGAQVVGLAKHRELLSIASSWMMRILFGLRGVRDYTCGFRAYRVGLLRAAVVKHDRRLVRESGFAAMAELLLNLGKDGAVIGEVPLLLRYDQKQGVSKMRLGRTIVRTMAMMMRHRFGRS